MLTEGNPTGTSECVGEVLRNLIGPELGQVHDEVRFGFRMTDVPDRKEPFPSGVRSSRCRALSFRESDDERLPKCFRVFEPEQSSLQADVEERLVDVEESGSTSSHFDGPVPRRISVERRQ